jgi:AraC-like DNA-binding protein
VATRAPRAELAPFIRCVWTGDGAAPTAERERVLPTGAMHLVIRLDEPLTIYAPGPRVIGHAVIGGARATPYLRDVSRPVASVGAQLRPGTAELLLGVPAAALAERHTALDEIWPDVPALRARLAEAAPADRLAIFEAALVARLPRVRAIHPAVAHALARFARADDVGAVVAETGYSHRRFGTLFHHAVGLTPKRYCRVQRLQRALAVLPSQPLAAVATTAGYADQAHLTREVRALTGLSPGELRALPPGNHVAVSGTFKTRR